MRKKTSETQLRAIAKYRETHSRQIKFDFNRDTDADILAKLDATPNKIDYVRSLIRADIAAHPDIEIQEDAE